MTWLLLAGLAVAAGLGLAGAVCLPGTRRRAGLDPRVRARWAAAGLAGAVALTYPGLVLLAVPAVARVLPQSALAAWPRLLAGLGPGGTGRLQPGRAPAAGRSQPGPARPPRRRRAGGGAGP